MTDPPPPPRLPRPPRRLPTLDLRLLDRAPLDLRILGRTLLHAALLGVMAGLVGVLFFVTLDVAQDLVLHRLTGYISLRASGEHAAPTEAAPFRPWLLWLIPAIGALLGGLLSARLAPETAGGGADANIDAFHRHGGQVRRRVPLVKLLASVCTLGSGGSGGREGPTMQIGGGLGAQLARLLGVGARERRVLLVAGTAAGMAAVFRTPLGAALLAVEVLYQDDFESEALIPALLASVVSYSVSISFFGATNLFAALPRYQFIPRHLPLYVLLAVVIALSASLFLGMLRGVQRASAALPVPLWVRPALGGLLLGIFTTPVLMLIGDRLGTPGQGFGVLGGGYGAAQAAIVGASWLPGGWSGVEILFGLGLVKMVATSLTVGSGGSAGDFGPSLVIGGLLGGAFGHAVQLLLNDPSVQPGAFALVGMGTFYGGLAHAPVSSLVMVCELAGSYDLLVPLMLAEGVAFVALRKRSLYHSQVVSRRESPAHQNDYPVEALRRVLVRDVLELNRPYATFQARDSAQAVLQRIADATWQDVFPVLGQKGQVLGLIHAADARVLAPDRELQALALAYDLMSEPIFLSERDDLYQATRVMLERGLRELPVTDAAGRIVGFLDEAELTRAYLSAMATSAAAAESA